MNGKTHFASNENMCLESNFWVNWPFNSTQCWCIQKHQWLSSAHMCLPEQQIAATQIIFNLFAQLYLQWCWGEKACSNMLKMMWCPRENSSTSRPSHPSCASTCAILHTPMHSHIFIQVESVVPRVPFDALRFAHPCLMPSAYGRESW